MSRWFRFYDDALNDPKILKLPDDLYRGWVQILCIASKNDGVLPSVEDVTVMLRFTSVSATQSLLDSLIERQLLDRINGTTLAPHNWRKRQYKSDVSTDRVKRFRERRRNVSETPPEQIQNRTDISLVQIEEPSSSAVPSGEAKKRNSREGDEHFIEFYSAYPKHQSKQDALKAYSQIRKAGVSHETIMAGLDRAKRGDSRFREMKFTPLPASWLRAGGFEDETSANPDWKQAVFG